MKKALVVLCGIVAVLPPLLATLAAAAAGPATWNAPVSVGSPSNLHARNAQDEPALAVDASRPDVLAAGANDLVDMQPCQRDAAINQASCPLNLGVGRAGVYFSFDRGQTWTQPAYQGLTAANCDPTAASCTPAVGPIHTVPNYYEAGLRTRSDLAAAPSVDIANGAPSGGDATNEIVVAWSDGRFGLADPRSLLSYSMDGGTTWSTPATVSEADDRTMFATPAISPDGKTLYVVYQAFQTPFQSTTANRRLEHGVLRRASIGSNGAPTGWTTVYSGPTGDARGTSQGRILYNEFLGDYVYAIATRTYGAGVWTDTRTAADCPAMDSWRQASYTAGRVVLPAPWPLGDCPSGFGNSDIWFAGAEH